MTVATENQVQECFLSHIIESGSGFAVRADNGEQVFVPPSVTKFATEGETAKMRLVPNPKGDASDIPWMAIRVFVGEAEPYEVGSEATLEELVKDPVALRADILRHFKETLHTGGVLTISEFMESFVGEPIDPDDEVYTPIKRALHRLHIDGNLVQARLHSYWDQSEPSVTYYALRQDLITHAMDHGRYTDVDKHPEVEAR